MASGATKALSVSSPTREAIVRSLESEDFVSARALFKTALIEAPQDEELKSYVANALA
ncbi:MAG: hypothetical protein IME98_03740, partial [Proteobacteria bacterium]|nr:hypothetical protein [Pseudomonadota bacterium]